MSIPRVPAVLIALFVVLIGLQVGGAPTGHAQQAQSQQRPASGQSQPQPQAQPPSPDAAPQATFRTDINFVRVDVIVTDNKGPVTDLKQSDFQLEEDGKPQSIEQFRLIKIDGNPRPGEPPPRVIRNRDDEESEAARDDVRVIVFFLDDYHTRVGGAMGVKAPLTQFIQTQLRPNDMLAVMYPLTPVGDVSFTRNHGAIISAINAFEGRKFKYEPRNQFEEYYSQQPTEVVEKVRNQVVMTALRGLSTRLGSIREGRKAIVYVSEGFTAMLPPQLRTGNAELMPPGTNGIGPLVGDNNPREDAQRMFQTADLYNDLREVYAAANRNNTAIYSLDPRGLTPNEFGIDENVGPAQDRVALQSTQDSLRTLSDQTDGRAIVGRNDLAKGLEQVVTDSSFYYLIGYTSSRGQADGKFHDIKVRVKRQGGGIQIRARRGYWAATAEDVSRANAPAPAAAPKPVETALATLARPAQASQYIRTWIGTERGEQGKTRVTLIWEPLAQAQAGAAGRRDQPGRVSVIAATGTGDLIFRGRSPDLALASSASASAPGATSGGAGAVSAAPVSTGPQKIVFDAPPGQVELRLSVEGPAGGVLDTEIQKVVVPDLTAPQAALSTPRVFRARTARDFQALARDGAALPVAVREFSRTERLLIRFDVYGPGTETPTATAVLLNRSGQKMADLPVTAATAGGTHQIDLGLASVPTGEYLVEITVKGTGEKKELVPLRIGS